MENLYPFFQLKSPTARIRPIAPSWHKSLNSKSFGRKVDLILPAHKATSRRFDRIILSLNASLAGFSANSRNNVFSSSGVRTGLLLATFHLLPSLLSPMISPISHWVSAGISGGISFSIGSQGSVASSSTISLGRTKGLLFASDLLLFRTSPGHES